MALFLHQSNKFKSNCFHVGSPEFIDKPAPIKATQFFLTRDSINPEEILNIAHLFKKTRVGNLGSLPK
jgi:hypothetical protein